MGKKNEQAAELGAKGGKASAESMTPEQLSQRGKKGAAKRWSNSLPRVTHGDSDHPLRIGDVEIGCYVLNDGRRVISQRSLQTSIGINESGGAQRLLKMMGHFSSKGVDCKNLESRITEPIKFLTDLAIVAHGYEATALADMCDVILDARKAGALGPQRIHMADQCEILLRSFARVGIIALIDEATGYQYDRPKKDLQEYLKKFLSEDLTRWVEGFPPDYFKHLCRLRGVELRPDMRLPQYFGVLTNNLIYRRIAPGLLRALKERRQEKGKKSNKLYWWTSADVGYPRLMVHLGTVIGLMKVHTDFAAFEKQLNQVAHIYPADPGLFDDPTDWQEPN